MTTYLLCAMIALPQSFLKTIEKLCVPETPRLIVVDVPEQKMTIFQEREAETQFSVSTGRNGVGQRVNTYQTPLGLHRIRAKIGKGAPSGAIFESRIFSNEIWTPNSECRRGDLITSRILWLEGLEPGFNSGYDSQGNLVDTYQRYIYIHGTNQEDKIGKPVSFGCIRMTNADVISFFDQVAEGDLVWIQD